MKHFVSPPETQKNHVHTAALLPPGVRRIVEMLAKREDRTLSAQMRQLTLLGLEQLGEWPPKGVS